MTLVPTPGQTVGPFFAFALVHDGGAELVPHGHPGAIRFTGRVLDGAGDPVPDALVEIWQAAPDGSVVRAPGSLHRDGFTFTGWGRAPTDRSGRYTFTTLTPGATTPGAAPYVAVTVFARGLLDRLLTRAYVPGDDAALGADPLLASVEEARRATLVATADEHGFVFDIRLQGDGETVFLDHRRD
ncbi:protocatechuate 3,4-dioxygenase alpha subunit [Nocardioides alpinus]|uniref:Protocatechuate 3,4-dioxygenase alpha subunit n=1 Tax=Nocardioides alpinus TaxID=748909 RepID=A0A1I0XXC1_9ACTN|nr:protocatechuate 3,4-dioxygenase subunit alpha [Nocardioides alpinus]PKH42822.1 protocatechuate 3,4-dioxygenase subunit alpha [Nocardioides alpinus]SFB04950.1 protocatechuate 3,4-dioxygenase alpha subunit [Nocardioides alpinus]